MMLMDYWILEDAMNETSALIDYREFADDLLLDMDCDLEDLDAHGRVSIHYRRAQRSRDYLDSIEPRIRREFKESLERSIVKCLVTYGQTHV